MGGESSFQVARLEVPPGRQELCAVCCVLCAPALGLAWKASLWSQGLGCE